MLTICSGIRFVDATIVSFRKRRPMAADYFLMYSELEWDILDHERSDVFGITRDSGEFVPISVERWVVDASRVPAVDLFYARFNRWFADESLKSAYESSGVTGCTFSPIEIKD